MEMFGTTNVTQIVVLVVIVRAIVRAIWRIWYEDDHK